MSRFSAPASALTTAALLARRSWRVLCLVSWRPLTYQYDGVTLSRRPFAFIAGSSPAWSRVLVELAQSQTFRRRVTSLDPMFQILAPKLRLEVPPEVQLFGKEIDREYPEVRRVVDELYAELARTNAAADAAFERDLVWPPGRFWERRETERVAASLPRFDGGRTPALLAEFPRDHEYRAIVDVPTRFASHSVDLPDFAVARLHGAWTRGVARLHGGEQEVVDFLVERLRAHGGEARLEERASRLVHKRGHVSGIIVDGDEETTGVSFVVTDHTTRSLLDLTSDFDPPRRALAALPHLLPAEWRFVVSIVVRNEGLPDALGGAFCRPGPTEAKTDRGRSRTYSAQRNHAGIDGATLLVAEAACPEGTSLAVERARATRCSRRSSSFSRISNATTSSSTLRTTDVLCGTCVRANAAIDRASLRASGGSLDAEPMVPRWRIEPRALPSSRCRADPHAARGRVRRRTERPAGAGSGGRGC